VCSNSLAPWVFLVALLFAETATSQEKADAERLESVLSWLPPDSESLVVANGPFKFPDEKTAFGK
jgi:hypothetical protein